MICASVSPVKAQTQTGQNHAHGGADRIGQSYSLRRRKCVDTCMHVSHRCMHMRQVHVRICLFVEGVILGGHSPLSLQPAPAVYAWVRGMERWPRVDFRRQGVIRAIY